MYISSFLTPTINLYSNQYRVLQNIPFESRKRVDVSKEQIEDLLAEGKTVNEICERVDISRSTYFKVLKRLGIESKLERISNIKKEQIEDLLNEGKTVNEICERLNISDSTYFNVLTRLGIESKLKRISNIKKEQIEDLIAEGKTGEEISKILDISVSTYQRLLDIYNIHTEQRKNRKNVAGITKEQIEILLADGKSIEEICERLDISVSTYRKLLDKYNIHTEHRKYVCKSDSITREQIESLLADGKTVEEICERLDISVSTYRKLLDKYNIHTEHRKYACKSDSITREQIEKLIADGKTVKEICERLDISHTTYLNLVNRYAIVTNQRKNFEDIASVKKEQIESLLADGKTVEEICEELYISKAIYFSLLDRLGIVTKRKKNIENVASITKEQIEDLIAEGKTRNEICETLHISKATYRKLLNKFDIVIEPRKNAGITKE